MTDALQDETTAQIIPEAASAVQKVSFAIINKYAKLLHRGPYSKEAPEHKRRIAALQSRFAANSSPDTTGTPPSTRLEEIIRAENSKLFNRYASSDAMFDHLKQEIIGQDAALRRIIEAMTKLDTERPLIHLHAKPGLGKSHIVHRVADAIGADCHVFSAGPRYSLGSAIIESASTAFNKKAVLGIDEAQRLSVRDQIILTELARKQIPGADVAAIFLMDTKSMDPMQFAPHSEAFWSRVTTVTLTMPDHDSFAQIIERMGHKIDRASLDEIVDSSESVRGVLRKIPRPY